MEPRIQYAQTAYGVSIAFWTLGEGGPFLYLPASGYSHIHLEWQFPEMRRWYEGLAEKRKLIRLDPRGFRLSRAVRCALAARRSADRTCGVES